MPAAADDSRAMSAPAQKPRPAPVSTMARTWGSASALRERFAQLARHDCRVGVELVRPVQRDGRHPVLDPVEDFLPALAHARLPLSFPMVPVKVPAVATSIREGTDDPHQIHGDVRRPPPHRAGRHAVGRAGRADVCRRQCRRTRLPHRADPADARGPDERDRPLPRHDRPAVRREPDDPADLGAAPLRRVCRRHRLLGHQDRRDRRQQSQGALARGSRPPASR